MKKVLFTLLLSTTLVGCATVKIPEPINGSKADGTVTLAYEYGAFEDPQVDWNLANNKAKARCAAWKYKRAQAFGAGQSHCTRYNGYGDCVHEQVDITYQCIN